MEHIVNIDSTNRDTTLYPSGNSYVLNLVTPIRWISRVELVSAKIPNTIWNVSSTLGTTLMTYTSTDIKLPPGFYSATGLANDIMATGIAPALKILYLPNEGKYLFYSLTAGFTITPVTAEFGRVIGVPLGTTLTGTLVSGGNWPQYASNPTFTGYYIAKSVNIIDLAPNEFIYLDIEELRTTCTHDSRKNVQVTTNEPSGKQITRVTTEGSTIENTFGIITMDVDSGSYKMFKEAADYKIAADYIQRIPKISKLTVKWKDSKGNALSFNGLEDNSIILRFICDPVPITLDRPRGLPSPVRLDKEMDRRKMMMIAIGVVLIISLFIISLIKPRTSGNSL
jgi:hypothetical protein